MLPPGTVVVSADSHYSVSQDIWYQKFPAHLRDRAPRVWRRDNIFHVGYDGKSLLPAPTHPPFAEFECIPGCSDIDARLRDLDAEGVDKELVYGNAVLALLFHADLHQREWIFRIYNEHLAEMQERAPGRFYGVGLINYWEPKQIRSSIAELKALGLKTFLLPMTAGLDTEGRQMNWHSDAMIPVWEAIEDAGLPVTHHIGESTPSEERSAVAIAALQNFASFRKMFGEYIFGGILDRHPKLKIVWTEGGINWVVSAIQDATFIYATHHNILSWKLRNDIPYYWDKHMYSTFMVDKLGLELLDRIGSKKAMWSSDYPHGESTFGFGWSAMQQVVDAASAEDARDVLGGNAIRVFDL